MTYSRKISLSLMLLLSASLLASCRGDDAEEDLEATFPVTADPDQFIAFLNPAPGVPKDGPGPTELDNQMDFPEAYYNTIDPDKTRNTFEDWRIANGFPDNDGNGGDCVAPGCVSTHVKFRDTKDLGYGRNMFMRWDKTTGDVAVYVENFQVLGVPGVPYGPLNLDALVENDRSWNFGVNAIEFSSFPYSGPDSFKFAKFYNFSGDGKLALLASGEQQHFVDLDNRGLKPMPTPCIVCHGGRGRTLVYEDRNRAKKLAPTIPGGLAGDVLANMQMIEFNTLQFSSAPGFTREENEAGIRLINEAILSTYEDRPAALRRAGEWKPDLAISILNERYNSNFATGAYIADSVPENWSDPTDELTRNFYSTLIGPNCMVCHALRGSRLNDSIAFPDLSTLLDYDDRINHLVFERGLMPAGLLNYADFWESGNKNPAELASRIGQPDHIDVNGNAIPPGDPVAVIAGPLIATGFDSSNSIVHDIRVSSGGSAFIAEGSQQWSVEPSGSASIAAVNGGKEAVLRVNPDSPGSYTVTMRARGSENSTTVEAQWSITVEDEAVSNAVPPGDQIVFYGPSDRSINNLLTANCVRCHSATGGFDGIAIHYEACQSAEIDGHEFLYRSVMARANFSDPLSSLILRKPINGATDLRNRASTEIDEYHRGNVTDVQLISDADISKLLSWILNGAPRGNLPADTPTGGQCL